MTATIISIVALCLAVAVLVIDFIPHSSVPTALRANDVPGLDHVSGLPAGVTVDPALASDPFTAQTVRALTLLAKITAIGGIAVWAMSYLATWALSATVLDASGTTRPDVTPLAWLGVALILAAFGQLIARGVAMRAELDMVI